LQLLDIRQTPNVDENDLTEICKQFGKKKEFGEQALRMILIDNLKHQSIY
jgi:hypothetical protein